MRIRFWWRATPCALAIFLAACEGDASRSSSFQLPENSRLTQNTDFSSAGEAVKLAESLRLAGAAAEALALLARAYRRYPKNAAVASAYGRLALTMGQNELAYDLLSTALAADPKDWRALSALGVLDGANGRLPDAREVLSRARVLSAEDGAVLNNLAMSYLLEGRAAEASSLFRQALASPGLTPARALRIKRNLAVALAVEGEFDAADRAAGAPMPRTLQHANGLAIAKFMGVRMHVVAASSGWTARFAAASESAAPAWR